MSLQILSELQEYTDVDGLVHPNHLPGRSASGNGLLYTSEAYIMLKDHGLFDSALREHFLSILASCQVEPGLYRRSPVHPHQQGPDDYKGVAAASGILELPHIAEQILVYGETRPVKFKGLLLSEQSHPAWWRVVLDKLFGWVTLYYNYNNVNPGTVHRSSWLGRQNQLITHLKFAAGRKPGLFAKLYWCAVILNSMSADKNNNDAWIMSYLLVRTAKGKSKLCDFIGNLWTKTMMTVTEGRGMGQYFVVAPIAKYWK
jgi:hypothetical protein